MIPHQYTYVINPLLTPRSGPPQVAVAPLAHAPLAHAPVARARAARAARGVARAARLHALRLAGARARLLHRVQGRSDPLGLLGSHNAALSSGVVRRVAQGVGDKAPQPGTPFEPIDVMAATRPPSVGGLKTPVEHAGRPSGGQAGLIANLALVPV